MEPKQTYAGPTFPPTNKAQYYVEEASDANEDAFDAAEILCAAASSGDVQSLQWMLDELKIPVDIPYERHGVTALSYACAAGEFSAVKFLLSRGADVNVSDPESGWTPIHHTVHGGYDNITEALLEVGAAVNSKDSYGWTPLHHASNDGHENVSRLLVKRGADLDEEDINGQTPLYVAAENVIKALIPSVSLETKLGTFVSFAITILGGFVTFHGRQEELSNTKIAVVLIFPVFLLLFFVATWSRENSRIEKTRASIRIRSREPETSEGEVALEGTPSRRKGKKGKEKAVDGDDLEELGAQAGPSSPSAPSVPRPAAPADSPGKGKSPAKVTSPQNMGSPHNVGSPKNKKT